MVSRKTEQASQYTNGYTQETYLILLAHILKSNIPSWSASCGHVGIVCVTFESQNCNTAQSIQEFKGWGTNSQFQLALGLAWDQRSLPRCIPAKMSQITSLTSQQNKQWNRSSLECPHTSAAECNGPSTDRPRPAWRCHVFVQGILASEMLVTYQNSSSKLIFLPRHVPEAGPTWNSHWAGATCGGLPVAGCLVQLAGWPAKHRHNSHHPLHPSSELMPPIMTPA